MPRVIFHLDMDAFYASVEQRDQPNCAANRFCGADSKLRKAKKMLVVEDVVTKGGRVQETIDIVHANGGYVVGVAAIVDRSNGAVKFGVPFVSLLSLQVEAFEPDKLPPDLKAIPAMKPGSK
jgi:orotate phosphoribosyltransferase